MPQRRTTTSRKRPARAKMKRPPTPKKPSIGAIEGTFSFRIPYTTRNDTNILGLVADEDGVTLSSDLGHFSFTDLAEFLQHAEMVARLRERVETLVAPEQ